MTAPLRRIDADHRDTVLAEGLADHRVDAAIATGSDGGADLAVDPPGRLRVGRVVAPRGGAARIG